MSKTQNLAECKLLVFDFDGVFTDNKAYVNEKGEESVRVDRSDTHGLRELRATGVDVLILSSEPNDVVVHRAKKINIPAINNVSDKGKTLQKEIAERNLTPKQTVYVGNDINDLPAFKVAGFSIAVANAHPSILDQVDHVTQNTGGNGAVREVIQLLLDAKQ